MEEALRKSNILTLIREKRTNTNDVDQGNNHNDHDDDTLIDDIDDDDENDDDDMDDDYKSTNKEKEKEKTKTKTRDEGISNNNNNNNDYIVWVGRLNFEKPREKEFPFRRTVFIFGIPMDDSRSFLHEMLSPFGSVSKIQFDHGPDGIDRKIGIKFLNKPRVYTLYYYDPNKYQTQMMNTKINGLSSDHNTNHNMNDREEMIFKTTYNLNNNDMIKCHKCGKDKNVSEGFYTTKQYKIIYCAQCAAQLAEDQLNVYYKERNIIKYQHNPKHKWLGLPPNDINKRKTALVVFASQRQASKCAYVRTRIAYKGSFATHFHHYSKVKKEIVLNESDPNHPDQPSLNDEGGQLKNNRNNNNNHHHLNVNNNNKRNKNNRNQQQSQQQQQQQISQRYINNQQQQQTQQQQVPGQRRRNNYNRRGVNQRNTYNRNQQQQQQYDSFYHHSPCPPRSQQSNKLKMKGPGLLYCHQYRVS